MEKELLSKIKDFIKNDKIYLEKDGQIDILKHNFSESLIKEAFLKGLIVEDKDLYPENPNLKHKGKHYYCLYKYSNLFTKRGILISFIVCNNIIVFHISPMNYCSKEERYFKRYTND